jgi:hypothetical protein
MGYLTFIPSRKKRTTIQIQSFLEAAAFIRMSEDEMLMMMRVLLLITLASYSSINYFNIKAKKVS